MRPEVASENAPADASTSYSPDPSSPYLTVMSASLKPLTVTEAVPSALVKTLLPSNSEAVICDSLSANLEQIKNEILMLNSRMIFMSSVEGLLFTAYGLCLKIFFDFSGKSPGIVLDVPALWIALLLIIPVMGCGTAKYTLNSLNGGSLTLDKIEKAWLDYVASNGIDASQFPPLRAKKYKARNSEKSYKTTVTGGRLSVRHVAKSFCISWIVLFAITVLWIIRHRSYLAIMF